MLRTGATLPGSQLPNEPRVDYHRFCVYRDLGPSRNLREAARRLDLSVDRVKQLSAQWYWRPRARLWDIVESQRRREHYADDARSGRQALVQEASEWQTLARAELARWVRRNDDGELELVRDLSLSQALRLWRVGMEAEQRLTQRGMVSDAREPLPTDPEDRALILTAEGGRRAEEYFRTLGIESSEEFRPGKIFQLVIGAMLAGMRPHDVEQARENQCPTGCETENPPRPQP